MPWGATTLGRVNQIAFANSPYQAVEGEVVEVDTTGGDVVVQSPPIGTGGKRFTVKKISNDTNTVLLTTLDNFESKLTGDLTNTSILFGQGETITYYADAVTPAWRIQTHALAGDYVEAFQLLTPPLVVGTDTTVPWQFVPIYPGQTQVLTSYLAGTFTFEFDVPVTMKLSVIWEFVLTSNDDASGSVDTVFSGAGVDLFLPIYSGFAHSRGGNYLISNNTEGQLAPAKNDTLRFRADDDVLQSGVTNIDQAVLFVGPA